MAASGFVSCEGLRTKGSHSMDVEARDPIQCQRARRSTTHASKKCLGPRRPDSLLIILNGSYYQPAWANAVFYTPPAPNAHFFPFWPTSVGPFILCERGAQNECAFRRGETLVGQAMGQHRSFQDAPLDPHPASTEAPCACHEAPLARMNPLICALRAHKRAPGTGWGATPGP